MSALSKCPQCLGSEVLDENDKWTECPMCVGAGRIADADLAAANLALAECEKTGGISLRDFLVELEINRAKSVDS